MSGLNWDGVFWNDTPLLFIDTETTGFSRNDRICSVSMVVADPTTVYSEFHSLVNPGIPIPADATNVHGIDDYDVVDSPVFGEILDDVLELLYSDVPWVAHNMSFDARMLKYDIPEDQWPEGIPTLCTLNYAKYRNAATKARKYHQLPDLARYFDVDFDPGELHTSDYDVRILRQVTPKLMGRREILKTMTRLSEDW